jgi:hypothetical protein
MQRSRCIQSGSSGHQHLQYNLGNLFYENIL